ncbi:MAG: hypothetical protein HY676_05220 [Chloroflexi bacterium]|nr:hypothetical protein [Chloroflexota bacterium]
MLKRISLLAILFALSIAITTGRATAQVPSAHKFFGSATLDGASAADGTRVEAQINGVAVAASVVSGGQYVLTVEETTYTSYAGKKVTFTVGGYPANESATFTAFKIESLALTAIKGVAGQLQSITGKYRSVWTFDAVTQKWKAYSPSLPIASDLTRLTVGDGYLIDMAEPATLVTSAFTKQLLKGWNFIGWLGP